MLREDQDTEKSGGNHIYDSLWVLANTRNHYTIKDCLTIHYKEYVETFKGIVIISSTISLCNIISLSR